MAVWSTMLQTGHIFWVPLVLLLAVLPHVRWLVWTALVLGFPFGWAAPSLAGTVFHVLTFDPKWVPRGGTDKFSAVSPELIFYDGACGLCHAFVRFLLSEDRAGLFRFAPLQSNLFATSTEKGMLRTLPDSIVTRTKENRVLVKSTAVVHILWGLGGLWVAVALVLKAIPQEVRDEAYCYVARIRHRLITAPKAAIPKIPAHLRRRFPVLD